MTQRRDGLRGRRAWSATVIALLALPAWAQQDISKINGRIVAEAGRSYGDLDTVNGGIHIGAGAHTGDVDTVNGGITLDEGASTGKLSTVNGGIRAQPRVVIAGEIDTVNGGVFIDRGGEVDGGIATVNGAIGVVASRLRGGIETVNGNITVGTDTQLGGGIEVKRQKWGLSLRPQQPLRVVIGPNAKVTGPLRFEREVRLYVHRSARIGPVSGARVQHFDTPNAPVD